MSQQEQERLIADLKAENDALKQRFSSNTGHFTSVSFAKKPGSITIGGYSGFPVTGPHEKISALMNYLGVPTGTGPVWNFIKQNAKRLGYVSVQ